MGRRNNVSNETFGLDEVDAFNNAREKILLEESGANKSKSTQYEDDDSDEEVLRLDDNSDSEDNVDDIYEDEMQNVEENESEEDWGGRENYYGADEIEDDDNAKLIEQEALRQQKKHLEELNMNDFVDDDMMDEWSSSKVESVEKFKQDIPEQNISSMDSEARDSFLKTTYPEFIPLSKEFQTLYPELNRLKAIKEQSEVYNIKFTALSAYIGTISCYFSLLLSGFESNDTFTMKDHPVMEGILSSREVWRQAKEFSENTTESMTNQEDEIEDILREEGSDLESDISDEELIGESDNQTIGGEVSSNANTDFDIDINVKRKIKQRSSRFDDFVEGDIADVDAEEKRARKRTLRFYTSKIDQAAAKKDAKYTGDMDLPYKERLWERQQRLTEEARKRGLADAPGAGLDENDFDSSDEREARDVNTDADALYYDTIKHNKEMKKENRKAAHAEAVKAAKEGKLAELQEELGEDGKRAINYQILKNKGLTPHRKKENRNSRVKKRKKYEKAQKKLKSVRAVYSEPKSAYEGEKTGIKKGISRSVKLV